VDDSGKTLDLVVLRDMMAFTHSLGIRTHLTFSFGLIGETKESMQQTLDLALELDPYTIQFSISTPFPGTRFYEYAKAKDLLLTRDFGAYDGMSRSVVRAEAVSAEELENYLAYAYATWRRHEARRRGGFVRRILNDPAGSARLALKHPRRAMQYAVGALAAEKKSAGVHDDRTPSA